MCTQLAQVDLNSIRLNIPMPFGLVNSRGVLLAKKGFIFQTRKSLDDLANHGEGFFVNFSDRTDPDLRAAHKAYIKQLMQKLEGGDSAGELTKVQVRYATSRMAEESDQRFIDWFDLIEACNAILRTRDSVFFTQRLESIKVILTHQLNVNPDEALMVLFYLSEKEAQHYCAMHSLLVCVICVLAASVLGWSDSDVDLLMNCALTMNIGMAALQDELSQQWVPVDISQQILIAEHSNLAVHILEAFGVIDRDWLDVVRSHHAHIEKPIQSKQRSNRLTGLINRADIFAAKLSYRVTRTAQHASVAMKSTYFDAHSNTDAMGAAILKTVGIYRPGSFVKLASGEVGMVIQRGSNTSSPAVAVVLNRDGMPVHAPAIRNTSDKKYAVISSVGSSAVKVTLSLESILNLGSQ